MATPEGKPKNYIVSGISKSLLTPCRRVGLSRKKKTPILNVLTPPNNSSIKKDDEDLNETPRKCLNPKLDNKQTLDKLAPKNEADEAPAKATLSCKMKTPFRNGLRKTIKSIPSDKRNSFSVTEDNDDVDETPKRHLNPKQVKAIVNKQELTEISHEQLDPEQDKLSPDETIPTNEEPKNLLDMQENVDLNFGNKVIEDGNCDINTPTLEMEPEASEDTNSEPNSPSHSPVISRVRVQVHRPVAKRSINFSENVESHESQLSEKSVDEVENSEIFKSKSKKRKLRLDSDDFDSVDLVESVSEKLKTQSKSDSIKFTIKSSIDNKSANSTMLARFTTEEYLKEFSENPKSFGEAMEMGSSSSNDYDDDFEPGIKMKIKKIESDPSKSNKPHDNYMAILCPSIIKTKEDNNQITSKKQLTVSLQRISNRLVNEKLEEIPNNTKPKSVTSKFSFDTNDSDNEMFTSSPETDKRQRENLLKLISEKEIEVQRKEESLERLRQAQVYKKKHSPSKLNQCSQMWMEGCKNGLKDLLRKMQEHGPMEMNTLLKNLRIPEVIVEKLNLL